MALTERQLNKLIEQKLRDGPHRTITKALIELRDARAALKQPKYRNQPIIVGPTTELPPGKV